MTRLKISGMTCGHCQSAVESALRSVAGVESVNVDLANGTAQVDGNASLGELIAAVKEEGYQASAAGTGQD